jgi:isoleucyl-tRNA synthetase
VNVKELKLLEENSSILVKSIKPNFKTIGPKYGKQMKAISELVKGFGQEEISEIEKNNGWSGAIEDTEIALDLTDFEINAQDIPGWLVASEGGLTVALDVTITPALKSEGIAREIVNRVQNLRKDSGFDVVDRILIQVETTPQIQTAIEENKGYICDEVLANDILFTELNSGAFVTEIETNEDTKLDLRRI